MARNLRLHAPDPVLVTESDLTAAALHEAGHIVVIEHVGATRIGKARVFADASGQACEDMKFPPDTPIECVIAIFLAGGMAQGVHLDSPDCSIDKEAIREWIAYEELSVDDALAAMVRARRIAKFGLLTNRRRLLRLARRLDRKGHA